MIALHDRQSHLEVMGVKQWYSRSSLSGALPSPRWLLEEAVTSGEASSKPEALVVSPVAERISGGASSVPERSSSKSAMDILNHEGLKTDSDQRPNAPIRKESNNVRSHQLEKVEKLPILADERALENFSLVLYKGKHGLILSESLTGNSHPSEFSLLKNILKSKPQLAESYIDCEFQQVFNWPVFKSLNLQSKQGAELRVLLSDWLFSHADSSISGVIYFGRSFPDINRYYKELLASSKTNISYTAFKHSLSDLIQFPQRKAELWSEICAFSG